MYNPITTIKSLYNTLIRKREIEQKPLTDREKALLTFK